MKFLFDFFKKLQNKPENIRKRWLWFFVFISIALVFYIWINSLSHQISPKELEKQPKEEKLTFWKIFRLGFINFYHNTFKPFVENFVEKMVVIFSLIFHYLSLGWQNLKMTF